MGSSVLTLPPTRPMLRQGPTHSHRPQESVRKPPCLPSRHRLHSKKKHPRNLQTDPLIHHGRHFGWSIYAFANIHALLLAGMGWNEDEPPETQQYVPNAPSSHLLTPPHFCRERREMRVYRKLLKLIPDLEERIMSIGSQEELMSIANMVSSPIRNLPVAVRVTRAC